MLHNGKNKWDLYKHTKSMPKSFNICVGYLYLIFDNFIHIHNVWNPIHYYNGGKNIMIGNSPKSCLLI